MPITPPSWNKNAAANVSCWQCENFQRYQDQGTDLFEGECRKGPPVTQRSIYDETGAQLGDDERYPFWLQWSPTQWCSGFQATLEANLPDPPALQDCNGPPILAAITPPQYQGAGISSKPWSKKPVEESCWHCEHFQREREDLQTPGVGPCRGWCRISPQDSYVDRFWGAATNEDWQSAFVSILWSTSMWCNRWERSRLPVPPEPDYGQGPCFYSPV
jgi:hypothetical protein